MDPDLQPVIISNTLPIAELHVPGWKLMKGLCRVQVKSLSSLGWFLSIGTFGQIFAALVLVYKLVMNPWEGATTEMVHNGEHIGGISSPPPSTNMHC